MASILEFDNINKLSSVTELSIEQYFSETGMTAEQKKKRIDFANDFWDAMLFLFVMYRMYILEQIQWSTIRTEIEADVRGVLEKHGFPEYIADVYAPSFVEQIMKTTENHLNGLETDDYWLSDERGKIIAENETSVLYDREDYTEAVADGKQLKTWKTMEDERVRDTHVLLDNVTLPINEPFNVGNSIMQYPHDLSFSPEPKEFINCRCWCEYF